MGAVLSNFPSFFTTVNAGLLQFAYGNKTKSQAGNNNNKITITDLPFTPKAIAWCVTDYWGGCFVWTEETGDVGYYDGTFTYTITENGFVISGQRMFYDSSNVFYYYVWG